MHSFFTKIVDEGSFPRGEMPANHGQVPPDGSMGKKLSNESVTIELRLCEQENP